MTGLPHPLPERGKNAALYRWLNRLRDVVYSLRPLQSHNTLTDHTRVGVYRHGNPRVSASEEPAEIGEIRQYDSSRSYDKDELAFCDLPEERDDGTQAGLYQALTDIAPGGNHPSVSANWTLVARAYWQKLRIKFGTRYIHLDCTAFQGVTVDGPKIEIADGIDENHRATQYLADIPDGAGPIKFRETIMCQDGVRYVCTIFRGPIRNIGDGSPAEAP